MTFESTYPGDGLDLLTAPRRRKRVSKRRWKARLRQGKWIPVYAVNEHQLLKGPGQETYAFDHQRDLIRRAR